VSRVSGSLARLRVRTHSVRARAVAKLPPQVRSSLRSAVVKANALRRDRRVDEWGDYRQQLSIPDWSTPLVGAPTGVALLDLAGRTNGGPAGGVGQPVDLALADDALRCAFVTGVFDVGGVGEVVAFLAMRLRGVGIRTAILNTLPNPAADGVPQGRLGQRMLRAGVEVVEADETSGRAWLSSWAPDVISDHGAPDWTLAYAVSAGIPYLDTLHGMHELFGGDWDAEARRARDVTRIVAVSKLVREQYLASNPLYPADRIIAIPNAVEDERFRAIDRDAARAALGITDEYLVVSLARHCLQKNTYGLVAAFDDFARTHRDAHLVIAGRNDDDRYYRHVRQLHESLASRNRIHLRDHLSEPRLLLAAADSFVLDSFFEGWSLASMEALFAGVPVVISDVGGAREQVGDDPGRGYVVCNPLGDPLAVTWDTIGRARYANQVNRGEFVDALAKLASERADALERRPALAAESARRFAASGCIHQHAEVIRAAAGERSAPRV
jgi:glycosyltransferase involved in cell wall biosynthesis